MGNSLRRPIDVTNQVRAKTTRATHATDANFSTEVLDRSTRVPVVLELWSSSCGPWSALGLILAKLFDERAGTVALAEVDVDANPRLAETFDVQEPPAVYLLRDGQAVSGFEGEQSEAAVRAWLDEVLLRQ
jgi:putative thioredoxin